MKNLFTAAFAIMLLTAGVSSVSVSNAAAKAAAHYDCTKKGNANKAACKSAATPTTAPVAATPAVTKKPGLMGSLMHPTAKTATPATMAAAPGAPAKAMSTASATPTGGHPVCKKGKPCGNSCIAQDRVCHKG